MPPIPVAIGLGTNLGDLSANLDRAAGLLGDGALTHVRVSDYMPSAPLDCAPGAPSFLNAALIGHTTLSPHELLEACQRVETALGRPRTRAYHADRTIDVDILLYGDLQQHDPALRIPHPELTQRDFVLVPLAQLAPGWTVPGTGATVADWLDRWRRDHSG